MRECFGCGALVAGICAGLMVAAGAATPALAEDGNEPANEPAGTPQESARRDPDFLFGRPKASVGVRVSRFFARADSEIFDFTRNQLTVDRRDFDAPAVRFDIGTSVNERLDTVFEVGFSRASVGSEFRDFVDEFDLPIVQQTRLTRVPVGGSLRFWLVPRGREVSRYAWVTNAVAPYVGAGGGAIWYRFEQFGEFVDFVDLTIFNDVFKSSGWALSTHVFGGTNVKLTRTVLLAFEARYVWADAALGGGFTGFDDIDLTGLKITTGIDFVF